MAQDYGPGRRGNTPLPAVRVKSDLERAFAMRPEAQFDVFLRRFVPAHQPFSKIIELLLQVCVCRSGVIQQLEEFPLQAKREHRRLLHSRALFAFEGIASVNGLVRDVVAGGLPLILGRGASHEKRRGNHHDEVPGAHLAVVSSRDATISRVWALETTGTISKVTPIPRQLRTHS